ncbi:5-formyltetrahydrofolate cyclo-ligase [bacterium]|nr:5-formyltetrahydrofolate cyclo-ligase [bacterium]
MDNKYDLRAKAKNIRKKLNTFEKSKMAIEIIKENMIYQSSKNIMLYYPLKYEINLLPLLKDKRNFYFPRVESENLLVCPNDGDFVKSSQGIFEPCTNPVKSDILDLIIVPALMADSQNFRLGYGGGYYDRFLKNSKIATICVIPKELFIEKLPVDEFDIKIDTIIKV